MEGACFLFFFGMYTKFVENIYAFYVGTEIYILIYFEGTSMHFVGG